MTEKKKEAPEAAVGLSREAILEINDMRIESVSVPEWGGIVYVKSMDGTARDQFESSVVDQRGGAQSINMINIRAKIASLTVCDVNGSLIFSPNDIKALGKKSASALSKVFALAQDLSGISKEDIDDYTKELEENPSDGSASN